MGRIGPIPSVPVDPQPRGRLMVPHKIWTTSRRDFLTRAGMGFGAPWLCRRCSSPTTPRSDVPEIDPLHPLAPSPSPLRGAKAKSCIFLFMEGGGEDHIDLFDPRPRVDQTGRPARSRPVSAARSSPRWAWVATTCSPAAGSSSSTASRGPGSPTKAPEYRRGCRVDDIALVTAWARAASAPRRQRLPDEHRSSILARSTESRCVGRTAARPRTRTCRPSS